MPYSHDGHDVPSYVPKSKRRQWAAVWNDSYRRHGDESRAFAEASAAIKKVEDLTLKKFGTINTGFTEGKYGPFQCGTCTYSKPLTDYHICVNDAVGEDEGVPEDSFGNKIIDSDDCCNHWTPKETEEVE